jgi:REP element-mobilizing transposase RayT
MDVHRVERGVVRQRKHHVQQELLDSTGTKPKSRRGGKRRGAGRPPKGNRAGSPHKKRPAFKASQPIHVVMRVVPVMGQLRRRSMFRALREATLAVASRNDFRIVHVSIQQNHVHLLVEADNKTALSRGMKAFEISAAKRMNAALKWKIRRRGKVFADRYHAEVIASPRQARHALAYVLNNWRKHEQDRGTLEKTWMVDPFSTATAFLGWKQLDGQSGGWKVRATYEPMIVWEPRTWLLKIGWRKHGLIDCYEVPSKNLLARRAAARAR